MVVTLPWPDSRLRVNARIHYMQRAKLAKKAREDACIATCAAIPANVRQQIAHGDERIRLNIRFCPPDKRRRDMDGMLSQCKASLDGFADALRVDDHRFDFALERGEPVKFGAVEVRL